MARLFSLLMFFLFFSALGQQTDQVKKNTIDSLRKKLAADSAYTFRKTRAKLYLRVENRNSFISGEQVNLFGFMAGTTFYEKHTVCAGYFYLYNRSNPIRFGEGNSKTGYLLSMSYYNFSYLHILLNSRFVQLNLPFEVGYGTYKATVINEYNEETGRINGQIIPYGGGLQAIFKPVRWAGVSLIGGYRFVNQRRDGPDFRGWYYTLGLWLDARQIVRSYKYRSLKKRYRERVSAL